MGLDEYHFVADWSVDGTAAEVYAILKEPTEIPRWWPSVYLDVKVLEKGGDDGVGRVVELFTKGWLPYTLLWKFTLVEARAPHHFVLEASGDFVGRGQWTITDRTGGGCDIRYDWRVAARKPILRYFSFALKPVFSANHRWAMARGEESLRLELLRRKAGSANVPDPPPATFRRVKAATDRGFLTRTARKPGGVRRTRLLHTNMAYGAAKTNLLGSYEHRPMGCARRIFGLHGADRGAVSQRSITFTFSFAYAYAYANALSYADPFTVADLHRRADRGPRAAAPPESRRV